MLRMNHLPVAARLWLLLLLVNGSCTTLQARYKTDTGAVYHNPIMPGDFADPSVIKVGDTYYATGTSSEWGPQYPLFTSKDLVQWKQIGYIFSTKPAWTTSSFWAPELYFYQGKFYVYYTARDANKVSYIGVAVANDPAKGFTDKGVLVKFGTEAIDAFVIKDGNDLYISWKAYGLDKRPIELLGSKLTADGLGLEGEPFTLLRDDNRNGMEGQSIVKRNGYYYLFYSAGGCCGVPCDYNVRVARSKNIKGPYEENGANPILQGNSNWMCTGHGTPVMADSKRWFYLYHAYHTSDNVFTGRQGMLDEMFWNDATGWPYFNNNGSPSVTAPVVVKGSHQPASSEWMDDFDGGSLNANWQWNFRAYQPVVRTEGGMLFLSGKADNNSTGTALCVRPVKATYEITAEILNENNALKGLVVYGDDNAAAGIGITGGAVQVWKVEKGNQQVLYSATLNAAKPAQLKIAVENGYRLRFYYSTNNTDWQQLPAGADKAWFLSADFLKQWDRAPRPGLHQQGGANEPACFSNFRIKYF
ncbi:family 43 glycosylhydrolase [Foetidibacter luteolus]|uniref:family 43 glycosylhydrolase n=1 Tax=Foetidibacter luteolus TaxID=2608880 RepID=UPI00129B4E22|nr:family 43 glycosylhydrolase [Foetidibacter luteolus]